MKYKITTGIFEGHVFKGTEALVDNEWCIWEDGTGRCFPMKNCHPIPESTKEWEAIGDKVTVVKSNATGFIRADLTPIRRCSARFINNDLLAYRRKVNPKNRMDIAFRKSDIKNYLHRQNIKNEYPKY